MYYWWQLIILITDYYSYNNSHYFRSEVRLYIFSKMQITRSTSNRKATLFRLPCCGQSAEIITDNLLRPSSRWILHYISITSFAVSPDPAAAGWPAKLSCPAWQLSHLLATPGILWKPALWSILYAERPYSACPETGRKTYTSDPVCTPQSGSRWSTAAWSASPVLFGVSCRNRISAGCFCLVDFCLRHKQRRQPLDKNF